MRDEENMGDTEQLTKLLRIAFKKLADGGAKEISPKVLANGVMELIDPKRSSPPLVAWGCTLELRQLGAAVTRRIDDPTVERNTSQEEMFDGRLYDWWPAKRNRNWTRVRREDLTLDERRTISRMLGHEIEAKILLRDAFDAETDLLVAAGIFETG
jgi:hypothetical protein